MINKISTFFLIVSSLFLLSSCGNNCPGMKEIEKEIKNKITIGDSFEQVTASLKEIKIEFSYSKYQNRYRAAITEGCGKGKAIIININFNDLNKLTEIEVYQESTFL